MLVMLSLRASTCFACFFAAKEMVSPSATANACGMAGWMPAERASIAAQQVGASKKPSAAKMSCELF
jgi:hypothetical protein